MYTTYYDTVAYGAPASTGTDVWGIIALILAIVGGVLLYFLFVAAKSTPKGKFAKWLKDFLSFKTMWIEPIMKVAYYCATIFTVLYSFSFFQYGGQGILYFFLMLIGGPIIIRLCYELVMMFIMIWRNTRDIAENTKKK
ncbi:MAG: hypothetical protein Q4B87_02695 [Candidatus Saccharibacteria bacterium]|nr:hypothetical protein [Candidatus Saccharibacteria bacterium]